jgi:hypothetical protein
LWIEFAAHSSVSWFIDPGLQPRIESISELGADSDNRAGSASNITRQPSLLGSRWNELSADILKYRADRAAVNRRANSREISVRRWNGQHPWQLSSDLRSAEDKTAVSVRTMIKFDSFSAADSLFLGSSGRFSDRLRIFSI